MPEIPEDLFVRVALMNSLITEEQLAAAQKGAAESGKPVAEVLIVQGALTREKADAVRAAIERKVAEKQAAAQPPARQEEPAPAGGGAAHEVAPAAAPSVSTADAAAHATPGVEHEYSLHEEEIKRLIRHMVVSPLHQRALELVVTGKIALLNTKELSGRLSVGATEASEILRRWERFKIAAPLGSGNYNFAPGARDKATIDLFLRCWRWPALHQKLTSYILEQSRK
jgi:hypothetical protein